MQVCSSRNGATVGISTQAVKIDEDRADLIQQVASPDRISNQDEPALENNNQEEKDHTPEEDKALLTDNCSWHLHYWNAVCLLCYFVFHCTDYCRVISKIIILFQSLISYSEKIESVNKIWYPQNFRFDLWYKVEHCVATRLQHINENDSSIVSTEQPPFVSLIAEISLMSLTKRNCLHM